MIGGVVVTGASSGIGAAIVRALRARGFTVIGTVRRDDDKAALEANDVLPVIMDVTDVSSIARAMRIVDQLLSGTPLVGLINNAGIAGAGPLELVPLDDVRRVLEVNVLGVIAVTQAFLPRLKRGHGRVINISSISGRIAFPFIGPYVASKFALEGLSDSWRRELLPFGVDVVVVEPGSIRTPIWDKVAALDIAAVRGTAYERVLKDFRDAAVRGGKRGLPPTRVADAVVSALTLARPPARIPVVRSRTRTIVTRLLPDRWLDRIVARRLWRRAQ